MKTLALSLLTLVLGFAIGWVSFRSKELAEYRAVIRKAGISDEQLVEAFKGVPTIMENMERDDRMTTVISLTALRSLEAGKIEDTKELLARQPASYYVIYGPPDHPKKKITEDRRSTLETIEKARTHSPVLDAAINNALKNVNE